jgi:hypothetical protein
MPGFMAQFIRFPKHRFSIILLCNISDPAEWAAMTENAERITDLYLADQLEPKSEKAESSKPPVVSVPAKELQKLMGSYRRTSGPEEGFIVNIGVDQERLVFTDHFGRETRLEATSSTQFRPVKSASDMKFEFSAEDGGQRSLTIETGSNSKAHYERIAIVKPTPEQLAAYAGSFYCDELLTTYFITLENDRLFLRINNRRKEELTPTIRDEFVPSSRPTTDEGRVFRFGEFDEGMATKLRVRLWRSDAVFERVRNRQ